MSQSACSEQNQTTPVWAGFDPTALSPTFGAACQDSRPLPVVISALQRHGALLAEIERLSSTGGFCWDPTTGEMTCTGEVYRILELDVGVPVTLELLRTRVHPDDLSLLNDTIGQARENTGEFECQLR